MSKIDTFFCEFRRNKTSLSSIEDKVNNEFKSVLSFLLSNFSEIEKSDSDTYSPDTPDTTYLFLIIIRFNDKLKI